MPQTITPEICSKLGEIGFDQDEINTIQMVHELLEFSKNSSLKKVKMAYHLLYAA